MVVVEGRSLFVLCLDDQRKSGNLGAGRSFQRVSEQGAAKALPVERAMHRQAPQTYGWY